MSPAGNGARGCGRGVGESAMTAFDEWLARQSTMAQSAAYRDWLRMAFDAGLEAAACIAETPITGIPHTEYSRGRMDAANVIAKAVRQEKAVLSEKKTRRL